MIRVFIGIWRVFWWMTGVVVSVDERHSSFAVERDHVMPLATDEHDESVPGSLFSSYVPYIYVMAVAVMVFLQLKCFLQSIHLLGKHGFTFRRTGIDLHFHLVKQLINYPICKCYI